MQTHNESLYNTERLLANLEYFHIDVNIEEQKHSLSIKMNNTRLASLQIEITGNNLGVDP